jgi:septal ring factor EnvC (AmiA/AmiB activator)
MAELDSARDALAEKERDLGEARRELGEVREALGDRERQLREVELKLLSTTQEMARNAGDYADRMREKDEELERYKVMTRVLVGGE